MTYSPPELYAGGSPSETCFVCNSATSDGVGSTAASVDPDNDVNPATGDFSTSDTLFDIPAMGPDMKFELTYSSQEAQGEAKAQETDPGLYSGAYGWGWGSNYNMAASAPGGDVTITEDNGSQVTFDLPGFQDSCPAGDYEDFQKYTQVGSSQPYCAAQRVDAQLGNFPALQEVALSENGGKENYAFSSLTGTLETIGDNNQTDQFTNLAASPGMDGCPLGVTSCLIDNNYAGTLSIIQAISAGLITEVIDPAGNDYMLGYNTTSANLLTVKNVAHNNAEEYFGYYNTNPAPYQNQLASIEDPNTNITRIGYGAQGMTTSETDPTLQQTTYSYGNVGCTDSCLGPGESQVTTVHFPDGEYDIDHYFQGLLTSSSFGSQNTNDADFETWTYNYSFPSASNQDGDTTETIVHPGAAQSTSTTVVVTDSVGNVLSSTDASGKVTQSMYNDTGGNDYDKLCWTAPPGISVPANATCGTRIAGSTSYTYDAVGNVTSETDPLGNTTRYGYYDTDQCSFVSKTYCFTGKLCWMAPPSVTGAGSTCTEGAPASSAPIGSTTYLYDNNANVIAKIVDYEDTAALQTTYGEYNNYGKPAYSIPPNGQNGNDGPTNSYATLYTYYSWGPIETTTAPDEGVVTDTFDAADNLMSQTGPASNEAVSYGYDQDERRCFSVLTAPPSGSCSAPPNHATVTTYQAGTEAPATVQDPDGNVTSYSYEDPAYPTSPTKIQDQADDEVTYNAYDAFGNACVTGPVAPAFDTAGQCDDIAGDTAKQYDSAGNVLASWDSGPERDHLRL